MRALETGNTSGNASSTTREEESILRLTEDERRNEAAELHPVDRGYHAWLFVFCAFGIEVMVWGFSLSYGIFQDWYLTHEFQGASEAAINAVGTINLAMLYGEGILIIFAARWTRHFQMMMRISLILCVLSLVATSFATQVWQLILFQGVLYGITGGLAYAPVMLWLPEWFVERRGLAGACIFGGAGFGGSIVPILLISLLQRVGFRWTLRIWSFILLVFGGLVVWFSKPRLPLTPTGVAGRPRHETAPISLKFLRQPLFLTVAITIFLQSLAYFSVSLYIPSYATALGFSTVEGTIALSVFNLASSIGQVLFGYYCDLRPFTGAMIFSGIMSSILAYALWGFAHNLSTLFVFVVSFASISGGFSAIQPPASATVASSQSALVVFCFFIVKGAAAIIGPLIAAALHPNKFSSSALKAGKGGWGGYEFTGITIFVGTTMAATALMGVASAVVRQRVTTSRAM
ncbi:MFS general substrate transporter [Clavulina sp. PMI_390]|nr:MFS general substrate transporter [Clavulina sp. PMI_390]